MEKENPEFAVIDSVTRPLSHSLIKSILLGLALLAGLLMVWAATRQQEATLEIRATREGVSLPDGFFVWHHLDANNIPFKSITPHHDGLIIRCMTNLQCEAARDVLSHTLSHDYVLALREAPSLSDALLARLRTTSPKMG